MSYRIMDKDYNFSHRIDNRFIHNMVRKESEISSIKCWKIITQFQTKALE